MVVKELVVHNILIVEQVHEQEVICYEHTSNERVREVVDRHREVVDLQEGVYVQS